MVVPNVEEQKKKRPSEMLGLANLPFCFETRSFRGVFRWRKPGMVGTTFPGTTIGTRGAGWCPLLRPGGVRTGTSAAIIYCQASRIAGGGRTAQPKPPPIRGWGQRKLLRLLLRFVGSQDLIYELYFDGSAALVCALYARASSPPTIHRTV